MNFEAFATALITAFIQHEFMQAEILAAGIKLESLPKNFLALPIFLAYQEKRKTKTHQVAAFELEREIAILERVADPVSSIPKNPEVLADKFQSLFEAYQFECLADELRKKPEAGRELIEEFQLKAASAVSSQTLAELSLMIHHQKAKAKEKRSVVSIPGFKLLSDMIGGFNPERLGILLGGTGFGKTNFAVNLSLAAARSMSVAYVNMEMGFEDMVKRFAVIEAEVSYLDYAIGNFDENEVSEKLREFGKNIHLTSGRALTYNQIASWLRLKKREADIGLAVIDYDQKVDLNLRYQVEEWKALQKVMESFEDLAKELNLYVLILAQVNREGLISGSHRAQFPAHTVLAFYEHELLGPIVEAKKNRHGKKSQAVQVIYDERNSKVRELSIVTVEKQTKPEKKVLKPKETKPVWWGST